MAGWRSGLVGGAAALWAALAAPAAQALTIIHDADIDHDLAQLVRPLTLAAGLSPSRIEVLLIDDPELNAFVIDEAHIFVNTGLVLRLKTATELQAVLAHELGHIANGHIARRAAQLSSARTTSGLGLLLGLAAAAAGAGTAAPGIAMGVTGTAQSLMLAHSRAEESAADASAVRYMAAAQIDPRAEVQVLDIFKGQEALPAAQQDVYVRSHPLTADRIRAVEANAASVEKYPASKSDAETFRRMRAKLSAYLYAPATTLRQYPPSDTSYIAEMARAVAYHREPDPAEARKHIDKAIAARPDDGYLYDLKGQILLESRDFKGAVAAYAKADQLVPDTPAILAGLGRAYLALDTRAGNKQALDALNASYARDPTDVRMLQDLALAYARTGDNGRASLATAERYAMLGQGSDALIHAQRASGLLPRGSVEWRRAMDIIHDAKIASEKG